MAIAKAAYVMTSSAFEAASLVWMELAMFAMAALLYKVCTGGLLMTPMIGKWLNWPPTEGDEAISAGDTTRGTSTPPGSRRGSPALSQRVPGMQSAAMRGGDTDLQDTTSVGACVAVLKRWELAKTSDAMPIDLDLTSVVEAMRKLSHAPSQIVQELRKALEGNGALLPAIAKLPAVMLSDDAVEMVEGTVKLLAEHGHPVEQSVYAGLMVAQCRHRDFAAVANTAEALAPEMLNPKMRATLAVAAAHRGRLDEALGHLRQMPAPPEGTKSAVSPAAAAQVLSLAAREQRVTAASEELQRVRARLETRYLDELALMEGKRCGYAICKQLLEAGTALGVAWGPGSYLALANALARDADGLGLRSLVHDLEVERKKGPSGIAVGEPLAFALLEACKAVRGGDLAVRIAELHRAACAGAPGAKVLAAACSALVSCDRGTAACDFYEREMAPKGIWPDAQLTTSLLKAAAQAGRSALAQRLADHQGAMRTPANGSGGGGREGGGASNAELTRHATMIKAYARERDLASASAVFNRLKSTGVTLSPLIYNCYLDACVQCGDLEGAIAHFEEMKELSFVDVVGYNTILKAHLSRGHTEEARALVKEMASRGLQANKVTYNELLHAKVIAKDRRGIWNLVDEMRTAGVRANSVTCSILLKSLTPQSSPDEVKRIMGLIEEVDDPIDEVLFSSVIEACIRIKHLDLLSDMMRRYRGRGGFVNLSAPTYGSMIKAYGQAGDASRVQELWQEMEERGVKPTSITVGCMVEALVANGLAEEAWELVHAQLESEERRGCINTVIYSTVLKGFAVAKRLDRVFAVYKEMRSRSVPCNTITYNTMLDACAKSCSMDKAYSLLEDMRESNVEPDIITYSTIVKGYCLEGDVDRAFSILDEMKSDDKFVPDEIMYNSILDGCAKQHRVDDALRVLEEMKASGVGPSNYTLSILVKLLGHARRLQQAFRMVEDLSAQNGFRPNVQVYTCLVQACVLNRRLEKALALHDTMVSDPGCTVDEKFYAVLARGCVQLHQPLKAVEVVRAAYQLPGHSLAVPVKRNNGWEVSPVGVDGRALEEVGAKLKFGGAEEQSAFAALSSDLLQMRGVRIGEGGGAGGGQGRRGGGGGGYGGYHGGGNNSNGGSGGETRRRRGTRGGGGGGGGNGGSRQ